MAKKRHKIGLLVANITDPFSNRVSGGAMLAAKDLDANLYIFPGKYIDLNYDLKELDSRYEYQYNALFSHAAAAKLDYLIICIGTIAYMSSNERKADMLSKFKDTPLLCVAAKIDGYDYLQYDNRTGILQAMKYLIEEQGKKHICMMVGDLNNIDCSERYAAYREALDSFGIEYEDRFIVKSDISSYCKDEADALLDANPEADAVLCVNDDMAATLYKSLKERGKHIGRDVAVVGFDDLPIASKLEPPLASVRADAFELGYRAMAKAVHFLDGVEDNDSLLPTEFIPRQSSYAKPGLYLSPDNIFSTDTNDVVEKIVEYVCDINTPSDVATMVKKFCFDLIVILNKKFIHNLANADDFRLITDKIDSFFNQNIDVTDSINKIYNVIDCGYQWVSNRCEKENINYVQKLYEYFYKRLSLDIINGCNTFLEKTHYIKHMDNLFIRDTLMFDDNLKESYAAILKKLSYIGVDTSYLYIFDEPVKYHNGEIFPLDMNWNFKSYQYGLNYYTVPDSEQRISAPQIFDNKYLPYTRRHTMIVADLYSTEYQYGIALCEPQSEEFFYELELVTYQLSAAVKIIELLKKQEKMLTELHSTNMALENMSKIDELTGIYNRRGFYSVANDLISREENKGETLIVCYGDMDNLKMVNDNYGHIEGDYSLKALAGIMNKLFGGKGVAGRMGGDEFAAVALKKDVGSVEELTKRKDDLVKELNEFSKKPYLINISIGAYECVCDNSYDFKAAIDKADDILYVAKSRRKKQILRTDE